MNLTRIKKGLFAIAAVAMVGVGLGYFSQTGDAKAASSAENLAGLIAVDNITGNGSFGNEDLSDLIIISGLFPTTTAEATGLAQLIAVDNTTGNGSNDSLSDLIIANGLFDV